jgi:thiosulfate/3-mercaptopyruvate sulfurtransferase
MYTTLISVKELQSLLASDVDCLVFDCTFELTNPTAGNEKYLEQHIADALRADLDTHLSTHNDAERANGGRHPLPKPEVFAAWLRSMGVNDTTQVVVYDRNGVNYCGRMWWMLKWCGHANVAVLDGGLQAWNAVGGAVATGYTAPNKVNSGNFSVRASLLPLVDTATVAANLKTAQTLIDARAPARFRGEVEPLDPVAGHIPGALNRLFSTNLNEQGFFKSPTELRQEFALLLNGRPPNTVVHHCGSGVSAIPNVLAMEIAGLGPTGLYAGSWSEWCNTPGMPCEKSPTA